MIQTGHTEDVNSGGAAEKPAQAPKGSRREKLRVQLGLRTPVHEIINGSFWKACLAEFFCTAIFIFVATGSVVFGCHSSDNATGAKAAGGTQVTMPEDCFLSNSRVLTIATAFGLTIAVLVYCAASFSGGHLNPAITLAHLLTRKITVMRAVLYWICQLAGAILGSSFVYAVDRTGWHAAKGATNRLLTGISPASGWLLEALLTMLLVFTVFCATDARRAKVATHLPILAPIAIGFAVFACHLAGVAIDGCSINPARSFGPAVISGIWTDQWIFWVGPFTGALVASTLYELLFRPTDRLVRDLDQEEGSSSSDSDGEDGSSHRHGDVENGDGGGVWRKLHHGGKRHSRHFWRHTHMPPFSGYAGHQFTGSRKGNRQVVTTPGEDNDHHEDVVFAHPDHARRDRPGSSRTTAPTIPENPGPVRQHYTGTAEA